MCRNEPTFLLYVNGNVVRNKVRLCALSSHKWHYSVLLEHSTSIQARLHICEQLILWSTNRILPRVKSGYSDRQLNSDIELVCFIFLILE